MDNFLDNGTILPHGLLGDGERLAMGGFNKAYKNTSLRLGIIAKGYDISDSNNLLKLTNEYDVLVFEQNEDLGSSIITYKNCVSSEGCGSIADFFEKSLRIRSANPTFGEVINTTGQDGALVLIQCLDGMSDKAIIIGGLTHPDRTTNLVNLLPYLEGEYNGNNIAIANDGSITFTFKGATDNSGNPIDSSQGNTVISVAKDGSFQIKHSTITFILDRSGTATLTTGADLNLTIGGNATVQVTGNVNVQCVEAIVSASGTATIDGSSIKLGANAAEAVVKGNTFKSYFDSHIHPTAVGPSGPPVVPMPGGSLSTIVTTE